MKAINALLDETNISGIETTILLLPVTSILELPSQSVDGIGYFNLPDIIISHPINNRWVGLHHTSDSGILKEEAETSDHNTKFEYSLECFIPKMYEFRPLQFQELSQMQFLVVCKDQNNVARILGLSEAGRHTRGCDLKWKYNTGKSGKDRNGYQLMINFETNKQAPAVKGLDEIPIELTTFSV